MSQESLRDASRQPPPVFLAELAEADLEELGELDLKLSKVIAFYTARRSLVAREIEKRLKEDQEDGIREREGVLAGLYKRPAEEAPGRGSQTE